MFPKELVVYTSAAIRACVAAFIFVGGFGEMAKAATNLIRLQISLRLGVSNSSILLEPRRLVE